MSNIFSVSSGLSRTLAGTHIVLPRRLSWPPSGHALPTELTGHAHLEPTWPASGYHLLGTQASGFLCPDGLQPAPRAHAVFLPGCSFNRRCQCDHPEARELVRSDRVGWDWTGPLVQGFLCSRTELKAGEKEGCM